MKDCSALATPDSHRLLPSQLGRSLGTAGMEYTRPYRLPPSVWPPSCTGHSATSLQPLENVKLGAWT